MAQCVIEHDLYKGKYLTKIEKDGKGETACQTNNWKPGLENALVFDTKEAVKFAQRNGGTVWQVRGGQPDKLIWPEEAQT